MNMKCSIHTHTTYCDGVATPREMVEGAIAAGCHTIGFSGHSPLFLDGVFEDWSMSPEGEEKYRREVLALREEYRGRVDVLLGLEVDSFSARPTYPYDYTIGSVHQVKKDGEYIIVDLYPEILEKRIATLYDGDALAYARDYYASVAEIVDKTGCDIVGHFDLLTKFNEKSPILDVTDQAYRTLAYEALDAVLEKNVLLEVNTGAIARGWKTTPYPDAFLMNRIAEKNGSVIITADAHNVESILGGYDLALSMLKENGVKNIYTVRNGKFVLADV